MDLALIERLIDIFERSSLAELDYAEGGARLRLARAAQDPAAAAPAPRPEAAAPAVPAPPAHRSEPAEHVLGAGIFGTFFRAPGPGQAPFVSEGDTVREGQTLAILEAMKVLNPVEADRAGRVARILAEDGATVEAGTPLFALAPAG